MRSARISCPNAVPNPAAINTSPAARYPIGPEVVPKISQKGGQNKKKNTANGGGASIRYVRHGSTSRTPLSDRPAGCGGNPGRPTGPSGRLGEKYLWPGSRPDDRSGDSTGCGDSHRPRRRNGARGSDLQP